jgi:hypothetical protein
MPLVQHRGQLTASMRANATCKGPQRHQLIHSW